MEISEKTTQKEFIEKNEDRFVSELFDLLRLPSVSADPAFEKGVLDSAEFIKNKLIEAGADNVELCETAGYPIVYGEKIVDDSWPTVLVYGHYDVQPADPYELWTSPPFEPEIRDNKIYARGACDDKGQMYMHIKAFETMMKTDTLTCNVKFMIEGEEEVGSDNLDIFVMANKQKIKADVILISDTSMISLDTPSITVGLRGMTYVEVEVEGPAIDLHSGVFGGAIGNPVNILCEMISKLKDENNRITIPGFYDKVEILTQEEKDEIASIPFDLDAYKKDLNIDDVHGERGYSTLERSGTRPTLDVNGIWGGYIGAGAKTVLPAKANAKISMRLVPYQNPDEITQLFQDYFNTLAPKSVRVKINPHHGGEPALIPTDFPGYKAASMAIQESFGKPPIATRDGGSIPIVAMFEKELGLKTILLGFGLDSDAIHSPDEHFGVDNFLKGIETIPLFFKHYREVKVI